MNLTAVSLSFLGMSDNPLNIAFGWLTRIFYEFFGSYGVAIIILTIVIRGLLIPLNVRSQKSMIKQQALASEQAEIRRKYPNDKQKQNEEMSKLLQSHGANPFGGCILPFIQLFFIWPIFYVVRSPLRYITQVSTDNLKKLGDFLFAQDAITKTEMSGIVANNIPIIRAFQKSAELLPQAVNQGLIKMEQMVDLNFLGIDLSRIPQWKPNVLFGSEWKIYVPLLVIPVLVLLTTLLQMRLTTLMKPDYKAQKEAKERARLNPARKDQVPENSMDSTMKMMNWMMPVIMMITTFTLPSAMGLYWLIGNLMAVVQQVIIYLLFTKPLEEKKAEMAILKAHAFSKAEAVAVTDSGVTAAVKSGKKSKKK